MRYLALGDSYTIGESVAEHERWPVQLVRMLSEHGRAVDETCIIACTGWTTAELEQGIDEANPQGVYQLVSLLVGVNNQYRGLSREEYRQEFAQLLERSLEFAGGSPGRVLVLSIPDWSVTPFAADRDRDAIALEIDLFNDLNQQESVVRGVHYLDVTTISRLAQTDASLLADDGLHPSGDMYRLWAELALPVTLSILDDQEGSRESSKHP